MNRHTGLYVDLGYNEGTDIVFIQGDVIKENITVRANSEFMEVAEIVADLIMKYGLSINRFVAYGHPAFEHAVKDMLKRKGYGR